MLPLLSESPCDCDVENDDGDEGSLLILCPNSFSSFLSNEFVVCVDDVDVEDRAEGDDVKVEGEDVVVVAVGAIVDCCEDGDVVGEGEGYFVEVDDVAAVVVDDCGGFVKVKDAFVVDCCEDFIVVVVKEEGEGSVEVEGDEVDGE